MDQAPPLNLPVPMPLHLIRWIGTVWVGTGAQLRRVRSIRSGTGMGTGSWWHGHPPTPLPFCSVRHFSPTRRAPGGEATQDFPRNFIVDSLWHSAL